MAFVNPIVNTSNRTAVNGGPFKIVQTANGTLYMFELGPGGLLSGTAAYFNYWKSEDYGVTWSRTEVDSNPNHIYCSVWYDRWSGISGDLIHMTFTDTTSDDVFYRSLDTSNDTLGTERLVFNGSTAITTAGGSGSIVVARGGNIYISYDIDVGTETGFYRSTDGGTTWTSRSNPNEGANDQIILMPGFATDNQDIMGFYWDVSDDEISLKVYDDSANSWSETSISTGMVEPLLTTYQRPWCAAVDLVNSKNILLAWNGVDTSNADLFAWSVDESGVTSLTNVVTNGASDQGFAALSISANKWVAYYCGKSDGADFFSGGMSVNSKTSTDEGTTWGSETKVTGPLDYRGIFAPPLTYAGDIMCGVVSSASITNFPIVCSVPLMRPYTNNLIGIS